MVALGGCAHDYRGSGTRRDWRFRSAGLRDDLLPRPGRKAIEFGNP
jgi:hypothetical protein